MGRTPLLPRDLLGAPFTVADAVRAGITRSHLRGRNWTRLGRSTYVATPLAEDPMQQLRGALRRLPPGAAFSGLTAAWLHGIDVEPCAPIEVTVPAGAGVSARAGVLLRRCALGRREVVRVRGLPATSAVRTLAEVCSRLALVEAVVIADAALHNKTVRFDEMTAWILANRGQRGIKNLRRVLAYAEPASESPMESRLRMLLILGGLPRPRAQFSIHDRWGRFVGRLDLYYEEQRLGIEYDGGHHRDALIEDNRRQNQLLRSGVRLLRFTAGDVLNRGGAVVAQVRDVLAGAPSTTASAGNGTFGAHEFRPNAGSRESGAD
jgi:very-short-patch-repair endonuclease